MPKLVVIDPMGKQRVLDAEPNFSVMETIRNAGIDGLPALCGGMCSCATCHVYVDVEFATLLPPMSEDEDALLDGSNRRTERSRLSCQIRLNDTVCGLRVTVVGED